VTLTMRALAFMVLVPVTGCERAASLPPAEEASAAPVLEDESELARYVRQAAPALGGSRSEILQRLGQPDSVHARTVMNRHDPVVTDSVFTLFYDGLAAVVYRAGYDGKEMLSAVEITDGRHLPDATPLGIGASAAAVRALLGEPDVATAEQYEFTCEECLMAGHETVRFALNNGTVVRIEFQYWID
jgi:hypothetical protein